MITGATWSASESCSAGPDGRWHYHVQFRVTVDSHGVGRVRYQWGRGADDVRSGVDSYEIGRDYAEQTVHVWRYDTISGRADSPTDTVIDRLHVLDPPGPNGQPFVAAMVHTICP
jgi:hypothetical protein